jgi:hypothetical protein
VAGYSDDEVKDILRLALDRQDEGGLSHEDLVAAADEVGIERAQIEDAVRVLRAQRALEQRTDEIRVRKQRTFLKSLLQTALLVAFLFGLDGMDGGVEWAPWPGLALAFIMAFRGVGVFFPSHDRLTSQAKRELARDAAREERRTRARRRQEAHRELESAIDKGVSALAAAIAKRVAPGERGQAQAPGPRVRVEGAPNDSARADDFRAYVDRVEQEKRSRR